MLALVLLHFFDVAIIGMFIDTGAEVEVVRLARSYLFWNGLFFLPLGALIVLAVRDPGGWAIPASPCWPGVAEMVARTGVALVLVPGLGLFRRVAGKPGCLGGRLYFPAARLHLDHGAILQTGCRQTGCGWNSRPENA